MRLKHLRSVMKDYVLVILYLFGRELRSELDVAILLVPTRVPRLELGFGTLLLTQNQTGI